MLGGPCAACMCFGFFPANTESADEIERLRAALAALAAAERERDALRAVPVCPYPDCQHPALSGVGTGGPVRADDLVPLRAELATAERERDVALDSGRLANLCPTCGDPWTLQLCARCTPDDDTVARLRQEVEYLKAELARATEGRDEARDILRLAGEAGAVLAAGRDAPWTGSTEPQEDEVASMDELRATLAAAERERDEARVESASRFARWQGTRDCAKLTETALLETQRRVDEAVSEIRMHRERAEAAESALAALRKGIEEAPVVYVAEVAAGQCTRGTTLAIVLPDSEGARRVRILEVPDGGE